MDDHAYDEITGTLDQQGATAALDRLAELYRQDKEFHRLFDVRLLRARHELGLPLIQTGPAAQWPAELRDRYEQQVIEACREVGTLLLDDGNIAAAYEYFQMIGEIEPVKEAIERIPELTEADERLDAVITIAVSRQVHPVKGLALMLRHYGTCQSITACEQLLAAGLAESDRDQCIKMVVRRLSEELAARLAADISQRDGRPVPATSIPLLIKGRDELFADDNYHIDTSHLNAVVRFARLLPRCEELFLAQHLCEYGSRLSERYRYPDHSPFEDVYADTLCFLKALAGVDVEAAVAQFAAKATAAEPEDSFPAEVYVFLLTRLGRIDEAIAFAGERLNQAGPGRLAPSINELCQRNERFEALAQWARLRDDPISFVAGMIQHRGQRPGEPATASAENS